MIRSKCNSIINTLFLFFFQFITDLIRFVSTHSEKNNNVKRRVNAHGENTLEYINDVSDDCSGGGDDWKRMKSRMAPLLMAPNSYIVLQSERK